MSAIFNLAFLKIAGILAVFIIAMGITTSAALAGCSYSSATVYGNHGGFTFYDGLIYQRDRETGKRLNANKAISVNNMAECAKRCLADEGCTGVTFRNITAGNCLFFAGHDFETNRPMSLYITYGKQIKTKSALIRSSFKGRVCQ